METSFAARRYGKPIPVARHFGLQSYRNAALLSFAQAARATISLMFKGFASPKTRDKCIAARQSN
jgi:hypothetical protein